MKSVFVDLGIQKCTRFPSPSPLFCAAARLASPACPTCRASDLTPPAPRFRKLQQKCIECSRVDSRNLNVGNSVLEKIFQLLIISHVAVLVALFLSYLFFGWNVDFRIVFEFQELHAVAKFQGQTFFLFKAS